MNARTIREKQFAFFLTFLFSISIHFLAQDKSRSIDQLLQSYHNIGEFNGSVLIAKEGRIIFKKGYGFANSELNIENTAHTKFRIASLTKQFTAMLIMQLKQADQLKLTDPISKFLPWYRKDIGDKVTIHNLLTHTSGIPDYTKRNNFFDDIALHSYLPKEFVEKFCSDNPQFEPGINYSYSNSGYYILGAIIEAVTHKTYGEVIQKQIFDVIGMNNSGMDVPGQIVKNRADGYNYTYGVYTNSDYINMASTIYAAGGLYSTVEDLLLWNNALYGEKLLSKENKEIMFTPFLNKYALGILVNKTTVPEIKHPITFMGHDGAINGFRSYITRDIEDKEDIILLSNTVSDFAINLNPIGIRIFAVMHNLPYENAKPSIVSVLAVKIVNDRSINPKSFFYQLKSSKKNNYDFTNEETELNSLGYALLGKQRIKDAIDIFLLNTEEFPNSWNTFDSYAEALMNAGQNELAIKNYKRSLELNKENSNAAEQIKILEKNKK